MSNAVVLLSGGQDSTTCLFWAVTMFDSVRALSIVYGQRHKAEVDAAREIAALAEVPHDVYRIPVLGQLADSDLVRTETSITGDGGRPDVAMPQGLPTSFVPGRNALFLTVAAAYAVKHSARDIVTGVCQTDFSGYPDCRREFIDAQERALTLAMPSSAGPIRVHTPLMYMTKAETVRLAKRLECWHALRYSLTCYNGLRPGCGTCPACVLRAKGFEEAGETDPALSAA
ncbi:MAG: 7-cyano-7-deazaguanine synthase QueC [Planctomycetes bacterium]|nr:7-cyano-7-deazaguanine synthase QueC [Planctomycetota bacterium]